jgi:hypothetical protein
VEKTRTVREQAVSETAKKGSVHERNPMENHVTRNLPGRPPDSFRDEMRVSMMYLTSRHPPCSRRRHTPPESWALSTVWHYNPRDTVSTKTTSNSTLFSFFTRLNRKTEHRINLITLIKHDITLDLSKTKMPELRPRYLPQMVML